MRARYAPVRGRASSVGVAAREWTARLCERHACVSATSGARLLHMVFRAFSGAVLAVVAAGCSQQDKKPRLPLAAVVGIWRSEVGAVGETMQPAVELRTDSAGRAELAVTRAGGARAVARGTWDGADSLLRVVVQLDTGIPRPTSVLFAFRGGALAATAVNGPMLGPEALGLRLRR